MLFQDFEPQYIEGSETSLNLLDVEGTIKRGPYYYEKGNVIPLFQFITSITDLKLCRRALKAFQTYFLSSPLSSSTASTSSSSIDGIDRVIMKSLQQCSMKTLPFLLCNLHMIFPLNPGLIPNMAMASLLRERGVAYVSPSILKDPLSFVRILRQSPLDAEQTESFIDYLLTLASDLLPSFLEGIDIPIYSNSMSLIQLSLKVPAPLLIALQPSSLISMMAFNHLLYSEDMTLHKKSILPFLSKNPPPPSVYLSKTYTTLQFKLLFSLSHQLHLKDPSFIPSFLLISPLIITSPLLSSSKSVASFAMKVLLNNPQNNLSLQDIKIPLDNMDILLDNGTLESYFTFLLERNENVLWNELVILLKKMILNDSPLLPPCLSALIKHSPSRALPFLGLVYQPSHPFLVAQVSTTLLTLVDHLEKETDFFSNFLLPYVEDEIIISYKDGSTKCSRVSLNSSTNTATTSIAIAIKEETPSVLELFISMVEKKDIYNLMVAPFINSSSPPSKYKILEEEVHSIIVDAFLDEVIHEDEEDLVLLLRRLCPSGIDSSIDGGRDDEIAKVCTDASIIKELIPLIEDDSYKDSLCNHSPLSSGKQMTESAKIPRKNILKRVLPVLEGIKDSIGDSVLLRLLQAPLGDDEEDFCAEERSMLKRIQSSSPEILYEISRILGESAPFVFETVKSSRSIYQDLLLLPHNQSDLIWTEKVIPFLVDNSKFVVQYLSLSPSDLVLERLLSLGVDGIFDNIGCLSVLKILCVKMVSFSVENLKESIEMFERCTIFITDKKNDTSNSSINAFLQSSIPYLEAFCSRKDWGSFLLSDHLLKGRGRLVVMQIIKSLQRCTRSLQRMCNHLKISKIRSPSIPRMKKVLERTIYSIKQMLDGAGCGDHFWIGNLRNRGLGGEVLEDERMLM